MGDEMGDRLTNELTRELSSGEALLSALRAECDQLGVEIIGVAPVPQTAQEGWFAPHSERLRAWVDSGAHADLAWIERQLEARADPQQLLPNARSAFVLWLGHRFEPPPRPPYRTARVAAYAWGRDYHNLLRRVVRRLSKLVAEVDPTASSHGSVDTSPVLERAFAERAAVGWIGRSTMLIHPKRGTYGSLAVLLTTASLPPSSEAPHPSRCGTCTDCWDLCPTGALGPNGLDARRCISYWTIEHRGVIPREMRAQLGEWVFGCDICQQVCPWNRRAPYEGEGARALWEPRAERAWPDLCAWLSMSDEALNEQLLGSPLRRAHPEGLKRNALIALANQGAQEAYELIQAQLTHSSEVVRVTALWALVTLTLALREGEAREERVSALKQRCYELLSEDEPKEGAQEALTQELTWALATLS